MSRKSAIPPALIVVLLAAWALLTIQIGSAWFGHQDANGAWISLAVRNYQWHGFFERGGMIDTNPDLLGTPQPYTHHPPLAVWIPALPVLLVGYDEAILRFAAACCTMIGAAALYVLARRLAGRTFALWSAAFYLLTPMTAYFGRMPDHEAPALMFCLLYAMALVNWLRRPARRGWWGLVALVILTAWTAWGGLIVIGVLTGVALFYTRKRLALLMLGVVAVSSVIAMLGYYVVYFPDALTDLINVFLWRTSTSTLEAGTVAFTWGEYMLREAARLVTLYTPTVVALVLPGIALILRQRGLLRAFVIALLIGGVGYLLLFRNASYIHDYYLLYTAPGIALLAGGAVALLPHDARWRRPLAAALTIMTIPASLYYLNQIYAYASSTLGLEFAQAVRDHTAPGDLIMSNMPSIGKAMEFYAERAILWEKPPAEALGNARAFGGTAYYLRCGVDLPEDTAVLAEVKINPQCQLTRLR